MVILNQIEASTVRWIPTKMKMILMTIPRTQNTKASQKKKSPNSNGKSSSTSPQVQMVRDGVTSANSTLKI